MLGVQSNTLWARYQELALHGEVIYASPVISNPQFQSKQHSSLPCLVVVSEEQSPVGVSSTGILAEMLSILYFDEEPEGRYPQTKSLLQDDEFTLFRRRLLPVEETDGQLALLIDVQLRQLWMPPPEFPFVPLLWNPASQGAVLQIPWSIVAGTPPVAGSMSPGRWSKTKSNQKATANASLGGGCLSIITKVMIAIFVLGLVLGLCQKLGILKMTGRKQTEQSAPIQKLTP